MNRATKMACYLFLVFLGTNAYSLQTIEANQNESYVARISVREVTRIAFEHGRIRSFVANDGEMQIEKNTETGQLFVRPMQTMNRATSIFLTDEQGRTYTLLLVPSDIPSDTILIKDQSISVKKTIKKEPKSSSLEQEIRSMVIALMKSSPLNTYEPVLEEGASLMMPEGLSGRVKNSYADGSISGIQLEIKNATKKNLLLQEKDFYDLGILAIVLGSKVLSSGQVTSLIVIRERKVND